MIQKIKKPVSILLTVLMVFSVFAVVPFTASAASNGNFDNLSWNLDDNGLLTFSGSGAIPNYGFDWKGWPIKKIIINDSVTAIGDCAFRGCTQLKEVVFESNPVLDWDSFDWCYALESVTLPQNMETICPGMFRGCTSLKTIELPATIKKIGMSAFSQSALESLTVPEGVEIGENAFEECASLQSLVLESSTPVSYQAGYLSTLGDVTTVTVSEGSHYDRKARTEYNLTLKEGAEIPEWISAEEVDHFIESANLTFNYYIKQGKSEEEALAEASDRMPFPIEFEVHKTEIEAYDQIFRTGDTCPDVFGGATLKVALDDATIAAINAINAIGTVELTDACKEKVDAARAAYDALNDVQKTFVPAETLATLEAAEDAMKVVASVTTSNGTTTKYANFSDALNAWTDSSTLTLLEDVQTSSTINVSGTKILDLNGHGIKMTGNGGVINVGGANLTLNDSAPNVVHKYTIADPKSNGAGLAVVDDANGNTEFTGGYITGGSTDFGGGVLIDNGTLTMNGGVIIGNQALSGRYWSGGGGVLVRGTNGKFTMTGGALIGNTTQCGGALSVNDSSEAIITGGEMKYNSSWGNGGAINTNGNASTAKITMSGGSITNNWTQGNAFGQGGGVLLYNTKLSLSGSPKITGNLCDSATNNVYFYGQERDSIVLSEALADDAKIGITMRNPGVFTNSTDTSLNDPTKFFSDNSNYIVGKNAAGQLLLGVPRNVTWNMDNGSEIDTTKVANGGVPTHANPTKPADDTNTYTFAGWKNGTTTYAPETLPEVTGDVTYTAQFTAVPKPVEKDLISGHSLTLDGDIGINFYIDPSVAGMTAGDAIDSLTYTLEWENEGEAKKPLTVVGKAIAPDNQKIIVTCKVCAAEMTCGVKASFSLGNKTENEVYSVRKYCDEGILADNAPHRNNEALYNLANVMLDYGAKAQTVFEVKTDDLANEGLKYTMPEDMPDFDAAVQRANGTKSNVANVTLSGGSFKFATLVFLSESTLRLYFENSGGLPTGSMTKWNDYYYIQKTDIPASKLDTLQKFTVGNTTLTYSALDYAKGLSTNANTDYVALAKAIYWYNQAANVYYHDADHTHTPGSAVQENVVPATCSAPGRYEEVVYCSVCGEEVSREAKTIDIDLNAHATTAVREENIVPATCTSEGSYDAVTYCTECMVEISRVHTVIPLKLHQLTEVAEVPATTGATGVAAHYECSVCHKLFSDAQGNDEVTADDLVIPKITGNTVDLRTLQGDYEAQNGDVLTGKLEGNKQITIADGATVTLRNANITCLSNNRTTANFAGITLLGDATILLEGENTVKGGYGDHPGVYVPEGKTLTIDGTGSLDASSNGNGCGIGAGWNGKPAGNIVINGGTITAIGGDTSAGIGGSHKSNCGDITITGGTVYAKSLDRAPGIGAGHGFYGSRCGNITISGGSVTAIGASFGSGIGTGLMGECGAILITAGVTQVTATKGEDASNSIGAGESGSCGTVTIENGANVTQN